MKITIINGPNINMLGIREKEIYGEKSYGELVKLISEHCSENKIQCDIFQSNHEGEIVDKIQSCFFEKVDGIIINPAAYTHTSVAVGDAIKAIKIPTVEVHISDVDNREDFRKINFIRNTCLKSFCGLGFDSYIAAIDFLIKVCGDKNDR